MYPIYKYNGQWLRLNITCNLDVPVHVFVACYENLNCDLNPGPSVYCDSALAARQYIYQCTMY